MQLIQSFTDQAEWFEPDDLLLKELATTLFHSQRYQTLYQHCQSPQDANHIDATLIDELVRNYHQVSERKLTPVVQRLNALL